MKRWNLSIAIFFLFMLIALGSCFSNEPEKFSKEEKERRVEIERDMAKMEVKWKAESEARDKRDDARLDSLGGVTEVEIKTRGCNNYQHSYSLKKKITDREELDFIASYINYRNLKSVPIDPCMQRQVILSVYIYEKREDYFKDEKNFVARCIKSGPDDFYTVVKKKYERL